MEFENIHDTPEYLKIGLKYVDYGRVPAHRNFMGIFVFPDFDIFNLLSIRSEAYIYKMVWIVFNS